MAKSVEKPEGRDRVSLGSPGRVTIRGVRQAGLLLDLMLGIGAAGSRKNEAPFLYRR